LAAGDRLIVQGVSKIKAGDAVRVVTVDLASPTPASSAPVVAKASASAASKGH